MKPCQWSLILVIAYLLVFAAGCHRQAGASLLQAEALQLSANRAEFSLRASNAPALHYRLDASRSKFVAHAGRAGLLWFKGHGHDIAVREFMGEVQLTPESITPASLEIIAKAASMEETSSVFTEAQKQIINKELREIVLLPDQHPDIVFKSTNVIANSIGADQYDLKITGNLTLLGVTRPITIPAKILVTGNELRAQGEFSVNRGDFKVKATSAFHGLVRVRDKVKFEFDIVGRR